MQENFNIIEKTLTLSEVKFEILHHLFDFYLNMALLRKLELYQKMMR